MLRQERLQSLQVLCPVLFIVEAVSFPLLEHGLMRVVPGLQFFDHALEVLHIDAPVFAAVRQ